MTSINENHAHERQHTTKRKSSNNPLRSPLAILSPNNSLSTSLKSHNRLAKKHQRRHSNSDDVVISESKNLSLTWPEREDHQSNNKSSWRILDEKIDKDELKYNDNIDKKQVMEYSLKSIESSIAEDDSLPVKKKKGENITTRRSRRMNSAPTEIYSPQDDRNNTTLSSYRMSLSTCKSVTTTYCKPYLFQYPEISPSTEESSDISQYSDYMHLFFEKAMKVKSSHQYQLHQKNPNLLSLEDVILPSIIQKELHILKKCQSKAQRSSDLISLNSVSIIQSCRIFIVQCGNQALTSAKQSRLLRESIQERERQQRKMERKEQRRLVREQKRKQRFLERKKMYPKNISLFREIAFLLTELGRLEKEEKGWMDAKTLLLSSQKEKNDDYNIDEQIEEIDTTAYKIAHEQQKKNIETLVNDITVSCNVINSALKQVSRAMEQSEDVKKELFQKYRKDLQFYGYFNYSNLVSDDIANDPETLFRSVCL